MVWELEEQETPVRFLIHDNDSKFSEGFDTVFASEGIKVIHTPYHAPNANAKAERWVRSVREECLDKVIILNAQHLRRVLTEYITSYNCRRPQQGLAQDSPLGLGKPGTEGPIGYHNVLGDIIRAYYRGAA